MSELDDIRSFVAVVDSGGFGRAGRSLGLSKSIVSRRVARLEADLGTRLLSRTTRGVSPTEAGLEFKARGERILAELTEAREAVALQAGGVAGRLRLSMPLSFGITMLVFKWLDISVNSMTLGGLAVAIGYHLPSSRK